MHDKPPASHHFEIMLPAGSKSIVESNTPELFQVLVPSDGVVSGMVDNKAICLNGSDVELTFECVNAVTVTDLTWVEQHTITRMFNTVSHFIRFVGGGQLRFAFSSTGDLLELSAEGVSMTISPDGQTLTFGPQRQSLSQGSPR